MSTIVNAPLPSDGEWPGASSAVTMAYVREPAANVSIPRTPCSSENCGSPCCMAAVGRGLEGTVTSIICTPPPSNLSCVRVWPFGSASVQVTVRSKREATSTYVLPSTSTAAVCMGSFRSE